MKLNKKGFTLVEIIATVTILAILSLLGIVSVNNIIQKGKEEHYKTTEKNISLTAETYAQTNRSYLPKNIGEMRKIPLRTLVEDNYIEEVKDYYDKNCNLDESYVQIFKYSKTGYSYLTYLNCPDYTNKEILEKNVPDIVINMTQGQKKNDKSNTVSKTEAKVDISDNNKLLSYSITIYRYNEEVYTTGNLEASYAKEISKTFDTSKYTPGTIKVVAKATNIYGKTTTATKEETYADNSGPKCIISENDKTRTDSEWTSGERTITVGCDDGEDGSGCTRDTYTKTFKTDAKYGTITIEDKSGNKTKCDVAVYIDKTAPSCNITASGTKGSGTWYKTNNVTMKITKYTGKNNTNSETQSPISGYDLTTSTTPTYSGTTDTKTQTNTTGTVWYGYVKDMAGNVSKCQSETIKVDTNAPTCSISLSGTKNGSYYASKVGVSLNRNDSNGSGIASYGLTTSSSVTYNSTASATQGEAKTGVTWYGYVKDNAGNTGSCNSGSFIVKLRTVPEFTYSGSYQIVDDNDNVIDPNNHIGNWKIRFLSSGTFTITNLYGAANGIDVFLVGGGGNGNTGYATQAGRFGYAAGGGGGGGGYRTTKKGVSVTTTSYAISVGGARTKSTAFGYTANPGANGSGGSANLNSCEGGPAGGSGGAAGGRGAVNACGPYNGGTGGCEFDDCNFSSRRYGGGGGGGHGHNGGMYVGQAQSQGVGSPGSGGAGGGGTGNNQFRGYNTHNGQANTGGGGGGGSFVFDDWDACDFVDNAYCWCWTSNGCFNVSSSRHYSGGTGGSGIVIIRNKR